MREFSKNTVVSDSSDGPLVTIVMSIYNAEKYLCNSLESLLTQTYRNLQIVIVNDGSTDGSKRVINSFDDRRIEFIDRAENMGLTKSLNQGLAVACGDYVARQDAGDISAQMRITEQIAYFQANPQVDVLGTGAELFDGRGASRTVIYDDHGRTFREQLLDYLNPFPHSSLMFKRRALEVLKGYNERFVRAQDYDVLLRASETFKMASLPKPLVKLRFTSDSLTHADSRQLEFGLAALICAHRRQLGMCDYSQGDLEDWNDFIEKIRGFVSEKGWTKRFMARTCLNEVRFAARAHKIGSCLDGLVRALASDAGCLMRKGIGIKIPDDIKVFLTDAPLYSAV